jgi:hypothetical protein
VKAKTIKIGDYTVLNANGYTKEQLNTPIPDKDYECIEQGVKIPVNYGMGIEIKYNGQLYKMNRGGHSWRAKPTVTLEIRSWRGISFGAIHYYGRLKINLPEMERQDEAGHIMSCWYFPMFKNSDIELTQVLEQWEKDKYPENHKYLSVGGRHTGFYTVKQVKDYAKEVFEKIFEKGWNYRVEEN